MTPIEQAAQQALEALEIHCSFAKRDKPGAMDIGVEAITALREALSGVQAFSAAPAQNKAALERVRECAARLVEHADFRLGGVLSADSKARDIPSRAYSQVKARHLAALRDALAASPTPPAEQQATSSAVLKAIREANMQLVRTGDDAFMLVALKQAAPQADSQQAPAQAADSVLEDAARWRWLSEHIGAAWNEGKFTSLVRIVSDKNRAALNASIDRMMTGDWSDAAPAAQGGKE